MKKNKKLKNSHYWNCVIGPATKAEIKNVYDSSLRVPVCQAFINSIGREADICSSAWVSGDASVAENDIERRTIYVVKDTCAPAPKKVILTRGEFLKLMTNLAKDYSVFAENSLKRNGSAAKNLKRDEVNDVMTDFLNFAAGQYGMDYGLKPWELKGEKERAVEV